MLKEALKRLSEENKLEIPDYEEIDKQTLKKLKPCIQKLSDVFERGIFSDEDIDYIFGEREERYYKRATIFGERAWLRRGKQIDVVLWDEGNGWYTILAILPHSTSLYEWLKNPLV
jgi:hypothetical protein